MPPLPLHDKLEYTRAEVELINQLSFLTLDAVAVTTLGTRPDAPT